MEGGTDHWKDKGDFLHKNSKEDRKETEGDTGVFKDSVLRRLKCFYLTVIIFTMKYEVIISSNCVLDHDKGWGMFEQWRKGENIVQERGVNLMHHFLKMICSSIRKGYERVWEKAQRTVFIIDFIILIKIISSI